MEPLPINPDQHPASHTELHDQLDDAFWFDQIFRSPKLVGFLRIERLERQLRVDASAEFRRQAESESEELRAERLERERQLRELVLLANETDDSELWRKVNALVFAQASLEIPPEAL